MIHILVIIILLPLAIIAGLLLLTAAAYFWKLIAALVIWAIAAVLFLQYSLYESNEAFLWSLFLLMVGCYFFLIWIEPADKDR